MAANDPQFGSVKALLHFDGANDGTTFPDVKGHTFTRYGNTATKTGAKKYGTASAYFDGAGDYLSSTSADYSVFTSGDFTIEAWVYVPSDLNAFNSPIFVGNLASNANRMQLDVKAAGNITWYTENASLQSEFIDVPSSVLTNEWFHLAVSRSGSVFRLFINGSLAGSLTQTLTISPGNTIYIGTTRAIGVQQYAKMYLDDFRLSSGARYTASFTPPPAAHPNYGRYVAGTITEDTDHTDFIIRTHRLDTGAPLNEITATGSSYECPCCPAVAPYTDYSGPVMVAGWPKLGIPWTPNTVKAIGDHVFPVHPTEMPYVFECTTAGTTHSTAEPTWPTTPANTVVDGGVTWQCKGRMVQPVMHGPLIPSI